MEKFGRLLFLSAILSIFFLATTSPELISVTPGPNNHNTTGNTTDSNTLSSNSTSQSTAANTTPSNDISVNSTSAQSHDNANSSSAATLSNSPAPNPTTQTEITSRIAPSASTTSLTTQHTTELTTASASSASTTFSVPAATGHGNQSTSNTATTNLTATTLSNNTHNTVEGAGLKHSEKSMTILFSVILGVIVLIVLGQFVYKVSRNKQRRVQYSHRPLHEEDTGEQFMEPDDTLVISGGLYDGSQIYNPTMSVLHEEEQPAFPYRPSQFRLEFLSENQEAGSNYEAPTCETFKPDQHP